MGFDIKVIHQEFKPHNCTHDIVIIEIIVFVTILTL